MKKKRALLAIAVTALVLTVILISLEAYYVAVALIVGTLIIGYRELWSLLRRKRMPPVDERIRENLSKSVRNGFIFFVLASAFLMLPFSVFLIEEPDTVHVLGGLFLAGVTVYLLSYLFYDRVEPRLSEKALKMMKIFLMMTGISVAVFIISVFLHNAIGGLFSIEEPVFFFIAVLIAPLAFAAGIIGSLVIFVKALLSKPS